MRQVPLNRDINIAVNGGSVWRLQNKNGPFTAMMILRSRGTCPISPNYWFSDTKRATYKSWILPKSKPAVSCTRSMSPVSNDSGGNGGQGKEGKLRSWRRIEKVIRPLLFVHSTMVRTEVPTERQKGGKIIRWFYNTDCLYETCSHVRPRYRIAQLLADLYWGGK